MADNTEIGTVRQVQTSDGLYDIEAPKLVEGNDYKVKKVSVANKGANTTAEVVFSSSDKNGGDNEGSVSLNGKGNLAVESLTKHVNIEAAQSIQLKPTNKIIIDTGRREADSGENEAILEVNNDDTKEWASFKIKSRNLDLRCHDHGGIALQPCGQDDNDFENKIKFESSRTSPLSSQNPTYDTEGGKGLEFGTFNNEHTSLFTGDYRFNKDGIVYAVTRGTPETVSGKTDYPTQIDDFKDILNPSLAISWEIIVKSAMVFAQLATIKSPDASDLMNCFSAIFAVEEEPEEEPQEEPEENPE